MKVMPSDADSAEAQMLSGGQGAHDSLGDESCVHYTRADVRKILLKILRKVEDLRLEALGSKVCEKLLGYVWKFERLFTEWLWSLTRRPLISSKDLDFPSFTQSVEWIEGGVKLSLLPSTRRMKMGASNRHCYLDIARALSRDLASQTFVRAGDVRPIARSLSLSYSMDRDSVLEFLKATSLRARGDIGVLSSALEEFGGICSFEWSQESNDCPTKVPWSRLEHRNFILNRTISYIGSDVKHHQAGIMELGGVVEGICLAWSILYRRLTSSSHSLELKREDLKSAKPLVSAWVLLLAERSGARVNLDSLEELSALMVRSRASATIFLNRRLDSEGQAWGILHELAHDALNHSSNTSYGLNYDLLGKERASLFDKQEKAADALASLWMHLLKGLADVSLAFMARVNSKVVDISSFRSNRLVENSSQEGAAE